MRVRRVRSVRAAVLVVLSAFMASSTLVACSGGEDAGGGSQTLTITSQYIKGNALGNVFRAAMVDFTKQTGIKVEIQDANTDLAKAYEAARLANNETDIVLTNYTPDTRPWVTEGQVTDVKPLISQWGLESRIKPAALEEWTNETGQVSAFPYTSFNWPIWYNTKLLKQAGVDKIPATVDELITAAGKLRAAKIIPFALGGGEWTGTNFWAWITQQYLSPEATKELYKNGGYCDNPKAMQGISLLTRLRDSGVFPDHVEGYTADMMTTAYFNGKAAMMPSGSWAYQNVPKAVADATVLGGFPAVPGGYYAKPTAFDGNTSTGIWISPNGKKKLDLAEKFVRFMYEPSTVKRFVKDAGMVPSTVLEGKPETASALLSQSLELPKTVDFIVLGDIYVPVAVSAVMTPFTITAYAKGKSPSDLCAAVDKIYKENK